MADKDYIHGESTSDSSSSSSAEDCRSDGKRKRKQDYSKNKRHRGQDKAIRYLAEQVSELQQFLFNYPPTFYNNETGVQFDCVDEPPVPNSIPDPELNPAPESSLQPLKLDLCTQLKEPSVPVTTDEHLSLLQSLQHFNTENWGNVRYSDVEKQYNSRPGYVDLEVNDEIKPFDRQSNLAHPEKFIAAVTYALILQSEAFHQGLKSTN